MAAAKDNKYAEGNKGGGRDTLFKEEYIDIAYKYCLLGATDANLAEFFEVSEQTINNWKKIEEFSLALKRGKTIADANVANSLYNRAIGYEHDELITASFQGQITDTMTVKKCYPPDTAAAFIWLKNRDPKRWRDKQEVDIGGSISIKVEVEPEDDDE